MNPVATAALVVLYIDAVMGLRRSRRVQRGGAACYRHTLPKSASYTAFQAVYAGKSQQILVPNL